MEEYQKWLIVILGLISLTSIGCSFYKVEKGKIGVYSIRIVALVLILSFFSILMIFFKDIQKDLITILATCLGFIFSSGLEKKEG